MPGPRARKVFVSPPVRRELAALVSSRVRPHGLVCRAGVVLDAAKGLSNAEIAQRQGMTEKTVRKWRARFSREPTVKALEDAPRSGAPARIKLEERLEVIKLACSDPNRVEGDGDEEAGGEASRLMGVTTRDEDAPVIMGELLVSDEPGQVTTAPAERDADAVGQISGTDQERVKAIQSVYADPGVLHAPQAPPPRHKYRAPAFRDVWTQGALVESLLSGGIRISRSEVGRILRAEGLRPHRMRLWLHSSDPQFRSKVETICGLYLSPPPGATVLSFDEKTCIQALERVHRSQLPGRRRAGKYEFGYKRHGVVTLLAAFNVGTGQLHGQCRERRTAKDLLEFMEAMAQQYPTGDVYIVWDNLNVHRGPRWAEFNARHGNRFHFVYTPLHASWVNQVEIWFSILQRRILRYGDFPTRGHLQARIEGFISHWNRREAHPFNWKFRGHFVDVDTQTQRAA